MEVRGGIGYIEDWVNARLVRDAHVGVLWEGTSNIIALDLVARAVGKTGAHRALSALVTKRLEAAQALPGTFRRRLAETFARAAAFAERVAAEPAAEPSARRAASALYHATSAVLLAFEGAQPGSIGVAGCWRASCWTIGSHTAIRSRLTTTRSNMRRSISCSAKATSHRPRRCGFCKVDARSRRSRLTTRS